MKPALLPLLALALYSSLLAEGTIPVSSLLNPDGTLNHRSITDGIVDATGFTIRLDPDRGPLVTPSLVTPQWNDLQIGPEGYPADVYAIALYNGSIYAGGFFYDGANNPAIDYIGRWDGCVWHPLASGLNNAVYALTVANGLLYIGGLFTDAGGNVNADRIASWNGTTFNNVGPGLNDAVTAMTNSNNGLVVAGFFSDAGNNADADGIAIWNGSAWNAMGTGIGAWVWTLAASGNNVYAGGEIAGGVMHWNGTAWSALGGGLNNDVVDIKVHGSDVYVAGGFSSAGGNPLANAFARWDGSQWHNVGDYFDTDMAATAFCIEDDVIYVAVFSYNGCWMAAWDMVEQYWDGGMGIPWAWWVEHLEWINDELYMGSANTFGGGGFQSGIYRWGEPSGIQEIMGVPYYICQLDPPIALPTTQSGYTGNWSGQGVSNNMFNPAGLSGYVTLTFTPNPGQCAAPTNFDIEVYLSYYYPNAPAQICELADPIVLGTNQDGIVGNWSGTGVNNNIFDPSGLAGNITLTFTPDPGQCATPQNDIINVETPLVPIITGVPNTICEDDDPIDLPQYQSGFLGYWSGIGVADNEFDPEGLNGIIALTFTPFPTECALDVNFNIEVTPVIPIFITGLPNELCQLANPFSLPTTQSGIQGSWSGPGVSNNFFNPSGLIGDVDLIFEPEPAACALPTAFTIDVYVDIPVITGVPESVCETSPMIALPTTQSGFTGDWSGLGVANNMFNPNGLSGAVPLEFMPHPFQCALPVVYTIVVDVPVLPVITGLPTQMCELDPLIDLPEVISGIPGSWAGEGVASNTFDPSGLSGTITLTFFPENGECALSVFTEIIVAALEVPQITGVASMLCQNASPQVLPPIQSDIPGSWSGPGVTNNVLYPAMLQNDITLTFTPAASACAVSTTWLVTLTDTVIPALGGFPNAFCESDSPVQLPTTQSGFAGNWSGAGINNNVFSPAGINGSISWMFAPNDQGCAIPAFIEVVIDTHVAPTLTGIPTALCREDEAISLSVMQGGTTGHWEGPGISHDTFSPADLEGNVLLSFIVDNGACEDTARTEVIILSSPGADQPVVVCDSTSNTYSVSFSIHGGDSTTYLVNGRPVEGSLFNSSPLLFTQSTFAFELTDANGCAPTIVSGVNPCACISSAGSMMGNPAEPLRICQRGSFAVQHNGDVFLDPDDALWYVLHNGTNTELGDILVASADGMISPPAILLQGHVYYITVLVGSADSNGDVDFQDPCLSIAQGIPVVFVNCRPDETTMEPVDGPGNVDPFQDDGTPRFVKQHDWSFQQTYMPYTSIKLYTASGILVYEGTTIPTTFERQLIPGFYVLHVTMSNEAGLQEYVVSKMILIN